MSFLRGQVDAAKGEGRYRRLHYSRNPFPTQGEVMPDVYVKRPELRPLHADLIAFLQGRPQGRVWALSGEQGVGKSNFLRMLQKELTDGQATGELTRTCSHLFDGNAWSPAGLIAGLMSAIGFENVRALADTDPVAPAGFEATDFGRLWGAAGGRADKATVAEFTVRWLSGGQTYSNERSEFAVQARDRLAPAIAVPYLRGLVTMLAGAGIVQRIVLLFDELENMQAIKRPQQQEYLQLLKTVLNAFNWNGLYVILAGAPAVFDFVASNLPSLAGRWQLVALEPLHNVDEALELANAYKAHAYEATKGAAPDWRRQKMSKHFPTDVDVKAAYVDLANRGGNVRQRALLSKLHQLVEDHLDDDSLA